MQRFRIDVKRRILACVAFNDFQNLITYDAIFSCFFPMLFKPLLKNFHLATDLDVQFDIGRKAR